MKKSKYRPAYEKLKAHYEKTIRELEEDRDRQALAIDESKAAFRKKSEEARALGDRLNRIEENGRKLTMENLMTRWHEIKSDTEILWITSPNISVVNAGTMANMTDRLKRLCPNIKMFLFSVGDISLAKLTDKELADMGLQRTDGRSD